jgi:hypothetical protein
MLLSLLARLRRRWLRLSVVVLITATLAAAGCGQLVQ